MSLTDKELHTASNAARYVTRINKGYVDMADVLSEITIYLYEHMDKVERWREEGKSVALYYACRRAGLRYADRERRARTGAKRGDFTWYSLSVIELLLPHIYSYDTWVSPPVTTDEPVRRRPGKPSETGDRLAMLVDIKDAVSQLSPNDQELLALRFRDGADYRDVGLALGLTEDGARRRMKRVLERVRDRLGGPPPFWEHTRRSISNAQAQAETRV